MFNNALGLQDDDDRVSSLLLASLLLFGRSSARMALDWVRAVGSTGSLISSWTSAGVRGVSIVAFLREKAVLGGVIIIVSRKRIRRSWRTIECINGSLIILIFDLVMYVRTVLMRAVRVALIKEMAISLHVSNFRVRKRRLRYKF
jgi:hypothetical protein